MKNIIDRCSIDADIVVVVGRYRYRYGEKERDDREIIER